MNRFTFISAIFMMVANLWAGQIIPTDAVGLSFHGWVSQTSVTSGDMKTGGYIRNPGIGWDKEIVAVPDLSVLNGSSVTSATIKLNVTGVNLGWGYGALSPKITIHEQNKTVINNVNTLNYTSIPRSSWGAPLAEIVVTNNTLGVVELSSPAIDQLVQAWLDGTKSNNGFVIVGDFKHESRFVKINEVTLDVEVPSSFSSGVYPYGEHVLDFTNTNSGSVSEVWTATNGDLDLAQYNSDDGLKLTVTGPNPFVKSVKFSPYTVQLNLSNTFVQFNAIQLNPNPVPYEFKVTLIDENGVALELMHIPSAISTSTNTYRSVLNAPGLAAAMEAALQGQFVELLIEFPGYPIGESIELYGVFWDSFSLCP